MPPGNVLLPVENKERCRLATGPATVVQICCLFVYHL